MATTLQYHQGPPHNNFSLTCKARLMRVESKREAADVPKVASDEGPVNTTRSLIPVFRLQRDPVSSASLKGTLLKST